MITSLKSWKTLSLLFFALFIISLAITGSAFAKETERFTESYYATTTNANCSDYYKLTNLKIDIQPRLINSVNGTVANFSGSIKNTNNYPIVNGKFYVKIIKENPSKNNPSGGAIEVVDAYIVKENINIKPQGEIDVDFTWKIPAFAMSGNYKVLTYFISSDKFNIAGLSFTDNVAGDITSFKIKGEVGGGVFFKRDGVKIENTNYIPGSVSIQKADAPIHINIPVTNTTKEKQTVKVEVSIYKLDSQSKENKLDTIENILIVDAGKTAYIPVVLKDTGSSMYFVESIVKYKDIKSIMGIRIARDGVLMPKINFATILNYPINSGKNTLFSCFQNISNTSTSTDGQMKMEVLTEDDELIASYEYDGKLENKSQGIVQEFNSNKIHRDFKIHVYMMSAGKIVDEIYSTYKCEAIDPGNCSTLAGILSDNWMKITFGILIIIVLLVLIFVIYKIFKNRKMKNRTITFVIAIAFLFSFNMVFAQSGSGSSSGGDIPGGGGVPLEECFVVMGSAPVEYPSCPTTIGCTPNKITVKVSGQRMNQVGFATSPHNGKLKILNKTETFVDVEVPRVTGESLAGPFKINLSDKLYLPKCVGQAGVRFVCLKPILLSAQPPIVKPGDTVTLTVLHPENVAAVKLENSKINNFTVTPKTDNTGEITFVVPRMAEGWKDVSIQSRCWDKGWETINDAIFVDRNRGKKPVGVQFGGGFADSYNSYSPYLNTPTDGLHFWYSPNNNIIDEDGNWDFAMNEAYANINYESNVTDAFGIVVDDNQNVPVGKKIKFNFYSPTSNSNIYWSEMDYYSNSIFGDWVTDATYPSGQVCTNDNYVKTKQYTNSSTYQYFGNVRTYTPLSVSPPSNQLTFSDQALNSNDMSDSDYPEWGMAPVSDTDSENWYCESENICTPVTTGMKRAVMYTAPTYGYLYYGWQTTDDYINNVCRTNSEPLNEKVSMYVNNLNETNSPQADNIGQPSFLIDSIRTLAFNSNTGSVVGCDNSFPFYNKDTNKCYPDIYSYNDSHHIDETLSSNPADVSLADYYNPFKLRFREYIYTININATSNLNNITPSAPIVDGPVDVFIGEENSYTAVSEISTVASKNNSSFVASVINGIKKVFAEEESPKVEYLFDFDGDDNVDYVNNPPASYGEIITATKAWATAGNYTLKVAARDVTSQNTSEWTIFNVSVTERPENNYAKPANVNGESCVPNSGTQQLKITWDSVVGATQYRVYKNSNLIGDNITSTSYIADYSSGSTYYVVAMGPKYADDPLSELKSSPQSDGINSGNMTTGGTFCQAPPGNTPINTGIKFYPTGWADQDGKCNFYGLIANTIIDATGKNYTVNTVNSCSVNSQSVNLPPGIPTEFNKRFGIGKRTLTCTISYEEMEGEEPVTKFLNIGMNSECSKAPSTIER